MKTRKATSTLILALALALTGLPGATAVQAQTQTVQRAPDSVVAVVADAMSLPVVPPDECPFFGTFWEIHSSLPCIGAPLPCPPFDPTTPVYALGDAVPGAHFLVDLTAGQVLSSEAQSLRRTLRSASTASIVQAQTEELQTFVTQIQAAQLYAQARASGQMSLLSRTVRPQSQVEAATAARTIPAAA